MGMNPQEIRMVSLGDSAGLGESDLARMDIVGEELKRLRFRVTLPQEQLHRSFPLLEIVGADKACSGCLIPLLSSLSLLEEKGATLNTRLRVALGSAPQIPGGRACVLVGDCAQMEDKAGAAWVPGCPPERGAVFSSLLRVMEAWP
jgi:hypothetical protein